MASYVVRPLQYLLLDGYYKESTLALLKVSIFLTRISYVTLISREKRFSLEGRHPQNFVHKSVMK